MSGNEEGEVNKPEDDVQDSTKYSEGGSSPNGDRTVSENPSEGNPRKRERDGGDDNPRKRVQERMVKVLLTNHEAGALIGRGGSTVNELQKRSGARVKVSNNTMMFPGTDYRIIIVEGQDEPMLEALKALVDVCFGDPKLPEGAEGQFVMALPSAAAPILIGKKGATVADLNKRTGCSIRLGRLEDEVPGVKERVTKFVGKKETIVAAVLAIVDLMFKDPTGKASIYENRTTNYDRVRLDYPPRRGDYRDDDRDSRYNRDPYPRDDYGRGRPERDARTERHHDPGAARFERYRSDEARDSRDYHRADPRYADRDRQPVIPLVDDKQSYSIQVSVPDDFVGPMLGRNGENLNEIQRKTRTRIRVSDRNEFVPNTHDRIVTILGDSTDCELARKLLAEKIQPR